MSRVPVVYNGTEGDAILNDLVRNMWATLQNRSIAFSPSAFASAYETSTGYDRNQYLTAAAYVLETSLGSVQAGLRSMKAGLGTLRDAVQSWQNEQVRKIEELEKMVKLLSERLGPV